MRIRVRTKTRLRRELRRRSEPRIQRPDLAQILGPKVIATCLRSQKVYYHVRGTNCVYSNDGVLDFRSRPFMAG
jgi:hypothetical protein